MLDSDQILTVAQMVAAEQARIDGGTSVEELMRIAGQGAGELIWRMSAGRPVTVLCGPGNNGGDGYVIAELLRRRGADVAVVVAREPGTNAARDARAKYGGPIRPLNAERGGEVFVDCLFGSGLNRGLPVELVSALNRLATAHEHRVAVDLPSGIESDSGALLNDDLPAYDLTIALGAWKFAHWTMPASARMGMRRFVGIGASNTPGAARLLTRPVIAAPATNAHKYTRGLLAVICGAMPGAALLACAAAQRTGAGYVKLLASAAARRSTGSKRADDDDGPEPAQAELVGAQAPAVPPDLVIDRRSVDQALTDKRLAAVLVGPGLGRDEAAAAVVAAALLRDLPTVADADALVLLRPELLTGRTAPLIITPHEGEAAVLDRSFGLSGEGTRRERALALARASGAIVLLKGSDSLIAAPDGRLTCAPPASSWLSTAGTGDVLAGIIASRLAAGSPAFAAAGEGLWLHGEAARLAGPALTASDLAARLPQALSLTLR